MCCGIRYDVERDMMWSEIRCSVRYDVLWSEI